MVLEAHPWNFKISRISRKLLLKPKTNFFLHKGLKGYETSDTKAGLWMRSFGVHAFYHAQIMPHGQSLTLPSVGQHTMVITTTKTLYVLIQEPTNVGIQIIPFRK